VADDPQTRFARVGDVHIAYQVVGDGPLDVLFVDTWVHHVEAVWDFPDFASAPAPRLDRSADPLRPPRHWTL
jgi:hypothetical protein